MRIYHIYFKYVAIFFIIPFCIWFSEFAFGLSYNHFYVDLSMILSIMIGLSIILGLAMKDMGHRKADLYQEIATTSPRGYRIINLVANILLIAVLAAYIIISAVWYLKLGSRERLTMLYLNIIVSVGVGYRIISESRDYRVIILILLGLMFLVMFLCDRELFIMILPFLKNYL
ncbi:hypothetical protein ACFLZ9_02025 [Patescibacteria group bacterium]